MVKTARHTSPGQPGLDAHGLEAEAREFGIPFRSLRGFTPDPALLARCPARLLLRYELLPLAETPNGMEVGTADIVQSVGLDALAADIGEPLLPVAVPRDVLQDLIKRHLGVGADTIDSLEQSDFIQVIDESEGTGVDLDESAQDASIIRFVNQILTDAITQRATDVHLEPFEEEFRIRYRIDGMLQDVPVPARLKRFQPAVVSRVKILSSLDVAEKRLPQDGRIRLRLGGADIDVRVSVIPMVHGEAVVLRLLRQDGTLFGLDELDLDANHVASLRELLRLPHGIILVTGPTGSGKTTTLYAALQEINDQERKIITVEDPVEYQINGINQIQVAEKTGLTFARSLRSVLRHDPDVVLIGEIRDEETASIAVQASLTGHLVFSTLHTNDSPGALTRLVDMGVEAYLVSSSVECVLAQRLARVLCPACKKAVDPVTIPQLPEAARPPNGAPLYQSVGCDACRQTGFSGRHAVMEILPMTERIRELTMQRASASMIRSAGLEAGWHPLCDDGWRLVRNGLTTVEEILRVCRDTDLDAQTERGSAG